MPMSDLKSSISSLINAVGDQLPAVVEPVEAGAPVGVPADYWPDLYLKDANNVEEQTAPGQRRSRLKDEVHAQPPPAGGG